MHKCSVLQACFGEGSTGGEQSRRSGLSVSGPGDRVLGGCAPTRRCGAGSRGFRRLPLRAVRPGSEAHGREPPSRRCRVSWRDPVPSRGSAGLSPLKKKLKREHPRSQRLPSYPLSSWSLLPTVNASPGGPVLCFQVLAARTWFSARLPAHPARPGVPGVGP